MVNVYLICAQTARANNALAATMVHNCGSAQPRLVTPLALLQKWRDVWILVRPGPWLDAALAQVHGESRLVAGIERKWIVVQDLIGEDNLCNFGSHASFRRVFDQTIVGSRKASPYAHEDGRPIILQARH